MFHHAGSTRTKVGPAFLNGKILLIRIFLGEYQGKENEFFIPDLQKFQKNSVRTALFRRIMFDRGKNENYINIRSKEKAVKVQVNPV